MDIVLVIARIVLAVTFTVSGVAKLMDLSGSRKAVAGFGVPESLAEPVGIALPVVELAVAIALVISTAAQWAGLGALILLLAFIAGISVNLARGNTPDCHCFGQLYSEPIGRSTLVRNVALAVVALFVAVADHGAAATGSDWPATHPWEIGIGMLALALLAAQGALLFQTIRENRQLRAQAADNPQLVWGFPVGERAPSFALPDLDGNMVSLEEIRSTGKTTVLVFTDPTCVSCTAIFPELAQWQEDLAERFQFVLITRGTAEDNRAKVAEFGLGPVLLQENRDVEIPYNIHGTPAALLLNPEGLIASPVAPGPSGIRGLVQSLVDSPKPALIPLLQELPPPITTPRNAALPAGLKIGDPAPDVTFTDFAGRSVSLEEFRGHEILLLFWSSSCGFCQQMHPALKQWEAERPPMAPELVVVIPGSADGTQVVDFQSTTLIERDYEVSNAFSVYGTPSGVLIDAEGRIGAETAVGSGPIFDLANRNDSAAQAASA